VNYFHSHNPGSGFGYTQTSSDSCPQLSTHETTLGNVTILIIDIGQCHPEAIGLANMRKNEMEYFGPVGALTDSSHLNVNVLGSKELSRRFIRSFYSKANEKDSTCRRSR
jgi:hypothetical protein